MGIIVVRHDLPVKELISLGVSYDRTVEEMIAEYAKVSNSDITSEHFLRIPGKSGVADESLYLVQPVPKGQSRSDSEVEQIVTAAGYEFCDWPLLGPLAKKEHADELWNEGIQFIVARGSNSRWQDPHGTHVVFFHLHPGNPAGST